MSRRATRAEARQPRGGGWAEVAGRRYEIRPAGLLYIAVTLFIAIGAVNSQNNLLFWLFGMAVGAIVVSGLISGSAMMGLRARRIAPPAFEAGKAGTLGYELRHRGRRSPAFALLLRELGARDREGSGRIEVGWAHVVHLAPGGRARARARVNAIHRGSIGLDRFEVSTTFPFGLFRKSVIFSQPASMVVTPARIELRELVIDAASSAGDRGATRPGRLGVSDEFFGLRAYVPGDSPRLISWKRSAALGELIVRQSSSPMPPRVVVALAPDVRGAGEREGELAIALAASVAALACSRGFLVSVEAIWAGVSTPLGGGGQHAARCLVELGLLELDAPAARRVSAKSRRGAVGRIIVTTEAPGADLDHPGSMSLSTREPGGWLAAGSALPEFLRDEGEGKGARARRGRSRRRNGARGETVKEVA